MKGYVQEVLGRLGARNRLEAVMIANRRGWLGYGGNVRVAGLILAVGTNGEAEAAIALGE